MWDSHFRFGYPHYFGFIQRVSAMNTPEIEYARYCSPRSPGWSTWHRCANVLEILLPGEAQSFAFHYRTTRIAHDVAPKVNIPLNSPGRIWSLAHRRHDPASANSAEVALAIFA
jgi:hypothetical protein